MTFLAFTYCEICDGPHEGPAHHVRVGGTTAAVNQGPGLSEESETSLGNDTDRLHLPDSYDKFPSSFRSIDD